MKKGMWLKTFLVLICIFVIVLVMFIVDFNLIASGNSPKFCFKTIKYENAQNVEYIGLGYKIIKYKISDTEQKLKVGSVFLRYDSNFVESLKPPIDIQGYIKDIQNNGGVYVIYIEENSYFTKKYKYDKAYAVVSNSTDIENLDKTKKYEKKDLKIGQLVNLYFVGNVQEIYPVRGTASKVVIVEDLEVGDTKNE